MNMKKKDLFFDAEYLVIAVMGVLLMIIAFFGAKSLASITGNYISRSRIINSISAGTICDKEIVNSTTSGGGGIVLGGSSPGIILGGDEAYIPTRYRLHISFEYEYEGDVCKGSKFFEVSEETYLAYNIGDYFDSHNYRTENVESLSP